MTTKHLDVIDPQTGHSAGKIIAITARAPCAFKEFAMLNTAAMLDIAEQKHSGYTLRVLIALLAALDYENWLAMKQSALAARIGMSPAHFSRGMRKLIEAGIVLKNTNPTATRVYRLNPEYVWRGTGVNHRRAVTDLQQERLRRLMPNNRQPPAGD